jgi:hypothetical protein
MGDAIGSRLEPFNLRVHDLELLCGQVVPKNKFFASSGHPCFGTAFLTRVILLHQHGYGKEVIFVVVLRLFGEAEWALLRLTYLGFLLRRELRFQRECDSELGLFFFRVDAAVWAAKSAPHLKLVRLAAHFVALGRVVK